MSLEKTFCSSPWFHMRINNSGTYESCRWMTKDGGTRVDFANSIHTVSPLTYFQKNMSKLRTAFLEGSAPSMCNDCYTMEEHKKISGRQRQLLKVGVQEQYFSKSLASTPLKSDFDYSNTHHGYTLRTVTDWQIDLGNYCNSACVFCNPESSSKLAAEFKSLGLIDQLPPAAWCDDPKMLNRFIKDLVASPALRYLHFIGGETLITPGFKKILEALVKADLAKNITVGFTTNLTVWSDPIINLLKQFQQVNLGISVESLNSVNDYVRWPSQLDSVRTFLDRWVALGQQQKWLIQLRITPTCLTVHDLDTIYEYAWQNNLATESCNFLYKPEHMRISVLPKKYRLQAKKRLMNWLLTHSIDSQEQIINTRNPNVARQQIVQDANSYLNYLDSAADETNRLPDLVVYLKQLESNRGNSILNYLPHYEDLFRSAGY